MQKHEYTVEMTCGGCSGAVTRVLTKKEGVVKFDVSLETQKVFVETEISAEEILAILKKTGKATTYVGSTPM